MCLMRRRDLQHHTYADYYIWSATHGDEVVDGVAYVREPPSPSRFHQEIAGELYRQIANSLIGKRTRAYIAPFDVRLPKHSRADDQIDTVVQPDVFIVRDPRKLDDRGMIGAPDWIAEILSRSTASYDRNIKLPMYERAGVSEAWLIDPTTRTVSISRMRAGHYVQPVIVEQKGQTSIAAIHGVSIDWDQLHAVSKSLNSRRVTRPQRRRA